MFVFVGVFDIVVASGFVFVGVFDIVAASGFGDFFGCFFEGVVDIVAASGFGVLFGRFVVDGGIVHEDGTLAPFTHEVFVVAFEFGQHFVFELGAGQQRVGADVRTSAWVYSCVVHVPIHVVEDVLGSADVKDVLEYSLEVC